MLQPDSVRPHVVLDQKTKHLIFQHLTSEIGIAVSVQALKTGRNGQLDTFPGTILLRQSRNSLIS